MADSTNNDSRENQTWPMPKLRFAVDLTDKLKNIAFQEVSGLDSDVQVIKYRKSNNKLFSTEKMPGIAKYGNVTLKRGIFVGDNRFWDWMQTMKMNTIKRSAVSINLLNENGDPTMTWVLHNAWPSKITGTDLKSDGNEVAVDTLELTHEYLTVTNAKNT